MGKDSESKDSEGSPPTSSGSGVVLPNSRSAWIKRILAIALTGIAFYVVLPSLARVLSSWPRLRELSPWWFGGTVLFEAGCFAFTFGLERLTLRMKSWFTVVTAGLVGNTVTNVLPGGDAAGAAVQFTMLSAAGIDSGQAAAGLSTASLLGIGALLALPVLALPAILGGSPVSRGLVHTALLGLVAFVLFAIGSVILLTADRPLEVVGRAAQWLWNHRPGHHQEATQVVAVLLHERDQVRSVLGRHAVAAVAFVSGRLGCDFTSLLCALRATGARPSPSLVLLAYAATGVVALLPLTPGGLGIVEASLSGLLVLAGVPASDAVLATLAYRIASYWLPILAGGVAYLLFRRRFGSVKLQGT
jgi:uncharacterized protein (TIRG00374 family)